VFTPPERLDDECEVDESSVNVTSSLSKRERDAPQALDPAQEPLDFVALARYIARS
jgi:hypothetical protein